MDVKMLLNDGSTISCKKEVQGLTVSKDDVEYTINFLTSTPTLVVRKHELDMVGNLTECAINIEPSSLNTILLK